MIRHEIRDAAIALGLPAAAAAGILAVGHHVLPWQHEAHQSPRASATSSPSATEEAALDLPPALNGLLYPQEIQDDTHGTDQLAVAVFFGGAVLTWAGTSFLPHRKKELQSETVISPTAIPAQLSSAQIEMTNVAAASVYETL
jgi:hypothetical protein